MGGGTEPVGLTHGAVAAMSGLQASAGALRPMLQLADAPRPAAAGIHPTERYGVLLSDGVHSQEAVLAASMNCLVRAGHLPRGSLVRVLDYVCSNSVESRRVIIVIQLEILQTECTLIGSPTIYDANAAQPKTGPYFDSLSIHRHCMNSRGKPGVTKVACSPDQSWLGSSKAARKDILHRCYGVVPTQNTIDAKMHQLSLNSYQGEAPSTIGGFDWPCNTYGHPVQHLYRQTPPMYMNRGPDLPEADKLRQWYYATTESKNNVCRTIAQIKDRKFGMLGQPDLITIVAAISFVHKDAFCYPACTLMFNGKQCNRKVMAGGDGWWCKRCLQSSETCEFRYILNCQIHDHTGKTYATASHEVAEEIIGHKAEGLFMMINVQQDDATFEAIMQGILWHQYRLKLRVKEGAMHGVKKLSIVKAEKLDPSEMSRHVLGEINSLLKGDSSSAPGARQGTNVTPSARRTSSQARLTDQTSDNAYGSGTTISYGHPVPVRRQMPTPPQATPNMHAECFKCSRGARSPMVPVGSPLLEAPSTQVECFRCSRGTRSPVIWVRLPKYPDVSSQVVIYKSSLMLAFLRDMVC